MNKKVGHSFESEGRITTSEGRAFDRLVSQFIEDEWQTFMSATSKKRSKRSTKRPAKAKAIDAPFEKRLWKRAVSIAEQYQLILVPDPEVAYLGRTVEMPFVMADAETLIDCATNTLDATALAVASMIEDGERPPSPASSGKRETQVNIRLNADEKLRLEEAARKAGFRSLSDFMRTAALGQAG